MVRLTVRTLGHAVRCDAPAELAGALLPLLPGAARATADRSPAEVRVRRNGAGWLVTSPVCGDAVADSPEAAATLAEWCITEERLAAAGDRLHIHAAGCVGASGAVLAVGPSGSGKSALALAWSLLGHPLIADDAVLADGAHVTGIARTVKLATPLARALGVAPERTVAWSAGSAEIWFDPTTAGGWAARAPLARVALVRWQAGRDTRMAPLTRGDAVRGVLACRLARGAAGVAAFTQAAHLLAAADACEIVFGDAMDAARRLLA